MKREMMMFLIIFVWLLGVAASLFVAVEQQTFISFLILAACLFIPPVAALYGVIIALVFLAGFIGLI